MREGHFPVYERRPFDLLWEKTICYSMREDHLLFCERRSFVLLWEKTICPSTLLWEYEVLLYEKTKCKSLLSSFEFVGKLDLSTRGLFWSKSNLRANQFEEGRLPPCVLSSVNRRVILIHIKFTGKSIRKKKKIIDLRPRNCFRGLIYKFAWYFKSPDGILYSEIIRKFGKSDEIIENKKICKSKFINFFHVSYWIHKFLLFKDSHSNLM